MKFNPITLVLVILFAYPLLKGFLYKYSSSGLKLEIEDVNKDIVFIISLFIGVHYGKLIFLQQEKGVFRNIYNQLSPIIRKYLEAKPITVYLIIIPICSYLIYKILSWIVHSVLEITIYPILDGIEKFLMRRSSFIKRTAGMLVQLPKSICYILLAAFLLNMASMFHIGESINPYLETSQLYRYLCKEAIIPITNSKVAKQLPNIIGNSFKVVKQEIQPGSTNSGAARGRTIIYYNGVTLDDGVKSNQEIDSFAKKLTVNENGVMSKAKIIYNWVGRNISYDEDKARKVMSNDFDVESGAIPTFNSRKGICFDYACLYAAMCRANGIKVRIITGEGFNGVSWVGHAWNQVYVPDSGKWINVDTTFYRGGNYFNSKRFEFDHKNAQIAGEW